jgi:hypothetical protein
MVVSWTFTSVGDWLAWGAVVVPLAVLAWSGWEYVRIQRRIARQTDFENFFQTLERIQSAQNSAMLQQAAVFELRNYPRYRDVVLRISEDAAETFSGRLTKEEIVAELVEEFRLTAEYIQAHKRG